MTRSEHQEMVEFIGPKFDDLDRRFETIDRRFDAPEERFTRIAVLCEDNRHQTEIVAARVGAVWSEFGRLRSKAEKGIHTQKSPIQGLDTRGRRIEA